MPVILPRDKEDVWSNPATEDKALLLAVLKPYPPEDMEAYEVTIKVNFPQYNTETNIQPL